MARRAKNRSDRLNSRVIIISFISAQSYRQLTYRASLFAPIINIEWHDGQLRAPCLKEALVGCRTLEAPLYCESAFSGHK